MPYHLEKGAIPRLLETYLNADRRTMRRRIDKLRASANDIAWLTEGVFGRLDPEPLERVGDSKEALVSRLMQEWFGCHLLNGQWVRQDKITQLASGNTYHSTGYWLAYSGNVAEIMRRALLWAMELALGLDPDGQGRGRWWPERIEILWKCPAPWFEAWVVRRPLGIPLVRRGIITLVVMTPSHEGSNVSESPVAFQRRTTPPPAGLTHPVPSWGDDYEELGVPWPSDREPPPRPRVRATTRRHAMWVVTHRNHVTTGSPAVTTDMTTFGDFWDWGIAQLSVYEGQDPVVVVSPSLAAGGVKHDGKV